MKCPKCGSNNVSTERRINGFSTCLECGYVWQNGVKHPELTLADKLLYLAKNTNIGITKTCMLVNNQTYAWDRTVSTIFDARNEKAIRTSSLAEAISKAYEQELQKEE